MKTWQFAVISIVSLLAWCLTPAGLLFSQGRGQGFRSCPYTPYMCPVKSPCKSFDENGKVQQVHTESLEEGMHPGMAVVVDTKTQGRVRVHLGPVWYLERQEFELKPGDEVRIKGMCDKDAEGRLQVIAYELIKGDHILYLRDSQGRPSWEAWRKLGD